MMLQQLTLRTPWLCLAGILNSAVAGCLGAGGAPQELLKSILATVPAAYAMSVQVLPVPDIAPQPAASVAGCYSGVRQAQWSSYTAQRAVGATHLVC